MDFCTQCGTPIDDSDDGFCKPVEVSGSWFCDVTCLHETNEERTREALEREPAITLAEALSMREALTQ
jgi:hypothetical protein